MEIRKNGLNPGRVAKQTGPDHFQKRHIRAVQAYRSKYDSTVPSGMLKVYDITPAGFQVPSALLAIVQREVVNMLPFLSEGQTYGVDELLGLQFLTVLNTGERRMVDQCLEILIRWGMPMQKLHTSTGQPPLYRFLGLRPASGETTSLKGSL